MAFILIGLGCACVGFCVGFVTCAFLTTNSPPEDPEE